MRSGGGVEDSALAAREASGRLARRRCCGAPRGPAPGIPRLCLTELTEPAASANLSAVSRLHLAALQLWCAWCDLASAADSPGHGDICSSLSLGRIGGEYVS